MKSRTWTRGRYLGHRYVEFLCVSDSQTTLVLEVVLNAHMLANAGNLEKASVAEVAPDVEPQGFGEPQGSPERPQGPAMKEQANTLQPHID